MSSSTIDSKEFISGWNWKTILALVVSILLFVPVNIYAWCILGMSTASVSIFFITILFVEVSRLFYMRFSKQESLILFYAAWWGGMSIPVFFNQIIFRAYFVKSPFAWSYKIAGLPVAEMIPEWLVPPYNSPALGMRTLFQPAYFLPVAIWTSVSILALIVEISLSVVTTKIYVETERLPFPFASVDVSMATYLSERPRSILKFLFSSILVGVIWGVIVYAPHSIGSQLIPIPFYDLTWALENILPGGIFAIPTQLATYIMGFIVPLNAATYMAISSTFLWTIMNSLFVTTFPDAFPEWSREYSQGMGLIAVQNRSQVRVWFAPQVGFTIAIAIFLMFKGRRAVGAMIKGLFKAEEGESMLGLPSVRRMLSLFVLASLSSVLLQKWLIPDMPLWVPLFYSFGMSFFIAVTTTAVAGEVGLTLPSTAMPGWTWHTLVYLTPYQGYAGFAFPPLIIGGGPQLFGRQVAAAIGTRTKPSDLIKLWILGSVLTMVVGLVSVDLFWRMAPIPSSAYPMTIYLFLGRSYTESMIVTRQVKVGMEQVFIPLLMCLGVLVVGDWLSSTFGLFFSALGITVGLFSVPYNALSTFIGSAIGRFLMPRLFRGETRWDDVKSYVVLGEFLGEGMIVVIVMGLAMISKSSWLWPW